MGERFLDLLDAPPSPHGGELATDAGRLAWLFGREVLPYDDPFDPEDYEARLVIDVEAMRRAFPEAME